MRWETGRRSSNIQDMRGMRMGGGGLAGLGGGGLLLALLVAFLTGRNPLELLGTEDTSSQVGAESGLLGKPALDLAVQFQGHHKQHVDLLAATVKKLGGTPAAAKPKYEFPVSTLKVQEDVLRFAAGLEKGAVSAYLNSIPILASGDLAKAAASILGDEAMHWAVLRHVLGENPVPHAFVS